MEQKTKWLLFAAGLDLEEMLQKLDNKSEIMPQDYGVDIF